MLFKKIKANKEVEDSEFDKIFPVKVRRASEIHFTPINVAKQATQYLSLDKGAKILDIGAGAGKFCLIGSAICADSHFTGVEQRKNFCQIAERLSEIYHLQNVKFINSNITNTSFKDYEAFYFYNSFYENISIHGKIDDKVELKRELYKEYSQYVKDQLASKPKDTRLVTYYSFQKEIPDSYKLLFTSFDDKLKMWIKR